jgi:hypothetical protein
VEMAFEKTPAIPRYRRTKYLTEITKSLANEVCTFNAILEYSDVQKNIDNDTEQLYKSLYINAHEGLMITFNCDYKR